jgi:hypothetical protein
MYTQHREITVMYKHWDGSPHVYGKQLAEFLQNMKIVDGIDSDAQNSPFVANGAECLAARIVAHFKQPRPGDIYLYPPKTRFVGEEYLYTVLAEPKTQITLVIYEARPSKRHYNRLFTGSPQQILQQLQGNTHDQKTTQ